MRLYVCKCGQKMRVEESKLGLRGHCPGCGKIVSVTRDNTRPCDADGDVEHLSHFVLGDPKPQTSVEAATPVETPLSVEAEAKASGHLPPDLPFELPFHVSPPPFVEVPTRGAFEQLLEGASAALAPRSLFAASVFPLGGALGALMLLTTAMIHPVLYAALAVLWMAGCAGLLGGYTARLAAIEAAEGRRARPAEGFAFLGRRFGELFLIFPLLLVLGFLAAVLVNGIVFSVAGIPQVGPLIAAVLVLPLFTANLLLLLAMLQALLLPCIMAVENQGLPVAFKRLRRHLFHRPERLLALELAGLALAMTAAALIFVLAALATPLTLAAPLGGALRTLPSVLFVSTQDTFSSPVQTGALIVFGLWALVLLMLSSVPWCVLTGCWTAAYAAAAKMRD